MNKNPDLICVADIHARDDDKLACRTDNFFNSQIEKFKWLKNLWEETGKPLVVNSGDLFHKWKSSPQTISTVLEYLPPMVVIFGNPGKHNYNGEEIEKDSLYTVSVADKGWKILGNGFDYDKIITSKTYTLKLCACDWGQDPEPLKTNKNFDRNILLSHRMIIDGKTPYEGDDALTFLKKHRSYDLIVTGHNHKPIHRTFKDRHIINTGSFTRQSADETHEPSVWLYWAKDNKVQRVVIPHDPNVMIRDYIEEEKVRDKRLEHFVESLNDQEELDIDYRKNVINAVETTKGLKETTKAKIYAAIQ